MAFNLIDYYKKKLQPRLSFATNSVVDSYADLGKGIASGAKSLYQPYGKTLGAAGSSVVAEAGSRLAKFDPLPDKWQQKLANNSQTWAKLADQQRKNTGLSGSGFNKGGLQTAAKGLQNTGKAVLSTYGAGASLPTLLTTAGLGGTLNTAFGDKNKSAMERFGEGVGTSPLYSGFGRFSQTFTNPYLSRLAPRLSATAGEFGQTAATRGVGSLANAIEGIGLDQATGSQTTASSIALDALTGLGGMQAPNIPSAPKANFKMDTKTFDDLVMARDMIKSPIDFVGEVRTGKRTQKEALKEIQKRGVEIVERLSAKYLPDKELNTLKTPQAKLNALIRLNEQNKLANVGYPVSNIAGNKPTQAGKGVDTGLYDTPLYHGTTQKFDKFDLSKAGTRNPADQGFAGKGIYLSNSKEVAETFAGNKDIFPTKGNVGEGRIIETRLDPKTKVLEVGDFGEMYKELGIKNKPDFFNMPRNERDVARMKFAEEVSLKAKEKGYDAIKVDGGGVDKYGVPTYEIVVFDPKNIINSTQARKGEVSQAGLGDTITLYRASPELPTKGNFKKGTYFADSAEKAKYYSESHLQPGQAPQDIKVEQFTLPKDAVFKEPSTGNYRVKSDTTIRVSQQQPVSDTTKSVSDLQKSGVVSGFAGSRSKYDFESDMNRLNSMDIQDVLAKGERARKKFKAEDLSQSEADQQLTKAIVQEENDTFKTLFSKWIGKRDVAGTTGVEYGTKFLNIPKAKGQEFINHIEGVAKSNDKEVLASAKEWKQTTDALYSDLKATAKEAGIKDLGFVDNYVTHYWKQSPEEVRQLMIRLSKSNPSFKSRTVPTYAEGIAIGLEPKYTDPAQIMSEYVRKLEQTKSNVELFNDLRKQGLVVDAGSAKNIPGFSAISAPGFPTSRKNINGTIIEGSYYAPDSIAQQINKVFSPEAETGIGKAFEIAGKASGKIQDITLSGGVPATPINAFTLAQVQKEVLSGNIKSPIKAFAVSLTDSSAREYFTKNLSQIKKMQARNVGIRTNLNTDDLRGVDLSWDSVVSDPTFKRFMPALQIEMFNRIEKQALRGGIFRKAVGKEEAADIAAKAVKNFYGASDTAKQAQKSKIGQDASKAFLFAPKFRESMINFWVNSIKGLKNPLALENKENTKFLVGAAITYGTMNYLNNIYNGKDMKDNPTYKKDKLLIPLKDGYTVGIPFLSSIATVPRGVATVLGRIADADPKGAFGTTIRTFGSIPGKNIGELFMNEDYFGKEIYDENATPAEKGKQMATYLFKNNGHPWLRAVMESKSQPLYQTLSKASEMPLRFYDSSSIATAPFWEKYNKAKQVDEQLQELRYKDPEKAVSFYNENKSTINELPKLKEQVKGYYESGKNKDFLTDGGVYSEDSHIAFIGTDGKFHMIDASTDIQVPQLTGSELLDKKLLSGYKSSITSAQNNIVTLFENSIINAEQAETLLRSLQARREIADMASKAYSDATKRGKSIKFVKPVSSGGVTYRRPQFKGSDRKVRIVSPV